MKKLALVAGTLLVGILIGSILVGSAFAAPPDPQATPRAQAPGSGFGMMGRSGGFGGMMGQARGFNGTMGYEEEVAGLLGMTATEIQAERQAGKSLVQIAAAKNVTEQQVVSTILAAKRAELDQLVRDGKLTQAQADLMYTNMAQQVPLAVNRTTVGGMMGRGSQGTPDTCPMFDDDDDTTNQPVQPRGRGNMIRGRGLGTSS